MREEASVEEAPQPAVLRVRSRPFILAGMAIWALGLVLTLAVPALHTGDRHWWPWTCVAGLVLGVLGLRTVRHEGRPPADGAATHAGGTTAGTTPDTAAGNDPQAGSSS